MTKKTVIDTSSVKDSTESRLVGKYLDYERSESPVTRLTNFNPTEQDYGNPGRPLFDMTFSKCFVQKASPGYWTTVIGDGQMTVENMARLLAKYNRLEEVSRLLYDGNQVATMLKAALPVRKIVTGELEYTMDELIEKIRPSLSSLIDPASIWIISQFLMEALSPLGIIAGSTGYTEVDYRNGLFPSREQLTEELRVDEIMTALNGVTLRVKIDAKKFTASTVTTKLVPQFQALGAKLHRIGVMEQYFTTALVGLKKFILHDELEEQDRMSPPIYELESWRMMAENITLVNHALATSDTDYVTTPEYHVSTALKEVADGLSRSMRYSDITLDEATQAMGHFQLTGMHDRIWGVVAYHNLATIHKSQIGQFYKSASGMADSWMYDPIVSYSQTVDSIITTGLPADHVRKLAYSAHSMLESKNFEEGQGYAHMQIAMSDADLLHYAMAQAKVVTLTETNDYEDETGKFKLMFKVDTNEVNLKLQDPELLNVHVTDNPMTYLMVVPTRDVTSARLLDQQAIPDMHLEKRIVTNPDSIIKGMKTKWTQPLDKSLVFDIVVGNQSRRLQNDLAEILFPRSYSNVTAVTQPAAALIFEHTVSTFRELAKYFELKIDINSDTLKGVSQPASTGEAGLSSIEKDHWRQQLATSMGHIIERIALSDAGVRMSHRVTQLLRFKLANEAEKDEKRE
jgi:hypothetical protein